MASLKRVDLCTSVGLMCSALMPALVGLPDRVALQHSASFLEHPFRLPKSVCVGEPPLPFEYHAERLSHAERRCAYSATGWKFVIMLSSLVLSEPLSLLRSNVTSA